MLRHGGMRTPTTIAACLLLSFSAACAAPAEPEPPPTGSSAQAIMVCASSTLEGIDVSEYNGTIDWVQVKESGRAFAIARTNDGLHVDARFAANWAGMHDAGLVRGAYQFFEPQMDAVRQADVLLSMTGPLDHGDLAPVLDVEDTGGLSPSALAAAIQTWVDHVEAATGRTPIVYTGRGFWNGFVGSTAFASDPLWVASWGVACPNTPNGWTTWSLWQYADGASVPGVPGLVPLDRFNGARADLERFADRGKQP